jgi:hypothetical protein
MQGFDLSEWRSTELLLPRILGIPEPFKHLSVVPFPSPLREFLPFPVHTAVTVRDLLRPKLTIAREQALSSRSGLCGKYALNVSYNYLDYLDTLPYPVPYSNPNSRLVRSAWRATTMPILQPTIKALFIQFTPPNSRNPFGRRHRSAL